MDVTIKLRCGACGSEQLSCADNPERDTAVTCAVCGDVATFGDLYDCLAKEQLEAIQKGLRDMLR